MRNLSGFFILVIEITGHSIATKLKGGMLYSSSGCQYYWTGHGILRQRGTIISEKQICRNMSHISNATRLMLCFTSGREHFYFARPCLIEYVKCVIFLRTHNCIGSSERWYIPVYITIETIHSSYFLVTF